MATNAEGGLSLRGGITSVNELHDRFAGVFMKATSFMDEYSGVIAWLKSQPESQTEFFVDANQGPSTLKYTFTGSGHKFVMTHGGGESFSVISNPNTGRCEVVYKDKGGESKVSIPNIYGGNNDIAVKCLGGVESKDPKEQLELVKTKIVNTFPFTDIFNSQLTTIQYILQNKRSENLAIGRSKLLDTLSEGSVKGKLKEILEKFFQENNVDLNQNPILLNATISSLLHEYDGFLEFDDDAELCYKSTVDGDKLYPIAAILKYDENEKIPVRPLAESLKSYLDEEL